MILCHTHYCEAALVLVFLSIFCLYLRNHRPASHTSTRFFFSSAQEVGYGLPRRFMKELYRSGPALARINEMANLEPVACMKIYMFRAFLPVIRR